MTKLFSAVVLIGLYAGNAYAIAPCGQVCRGPNEPCSLRCYLPGPFVTTCDQVFGGKCVPVGLADDAQDARESAVCSSDLDLVGGDLAPLDLAPVVTAWFDAGIAFAGDVVTVFDAVLG